MHAVGTVVTYFQKFGETKNNLIYAKLSRYYAISHPRHLHAVGIVITLSWVGDKVGISLQILMAFFMNT